MNKMSYYNGLFDGYFAVRRLKVVIIAMLIGVLGMIYNLIRPINETNFKLDDPEYMIGYIYMFFRTTLRYSFFGVILHVVITLLLLVVVMKFWLNIYSLLLLIIFFII